jgi:hypothetical protein
MMIANRYNLDLISYIVIFHLICWLFFSFETLFLDFEILIYIFALLPISFFLKNLVFTAVEYLLASDHFLTYFTTIAIISFNSICLKANHLSALTKSINLNQPI